MQMNSHLHMNESNMHAHTEYSEGFWLLGIHVACWVLYMLIEVWHCKIESLVPIELRYIAIFVVVCLYMSWKMYLCQSLHVMWHHIS